MANGEKAAERGNSGSAKPEVVDGAGRPDALVVALFGARPRLGATSLAYGMAGALAEYLGSTTWVVDLDGSKNLDTLAKLPGSGGGNLAVKRIAATGGEASGLGDAYDYLSNQHGGGARPSIPIAETYGVEVVGAPAGLDADAANRIIDRLIREYGARVVVVVGMVDPSSHEQRKLDACANSVCGRSRTVFYLTDDSTEPWYLTNTPPSARTWVYRMTAAYIEREREEIRDLDAAPKLAGAGRKQEQKLAALPSDPLVSEARIASGTGGARTQDGAHLFNLIASNASKASTSGGSWRGTVRVPEDPENADILERGGLRDLLLADDRDCPTRRAFFRLARVVLGRTVGLALGGGGAWGFSHVALIEHLEKHDIPIDYIAGTSLGAVVGGLYAAGGMPALRQALTDHGERRGFLETAKSKLDMFLAMGGLPLTEREVRRTLERALGAKLAEERNYLATTEIPFFPVAVDLATHTEIPVGADFDPEGEHAEVVNVRGTVGWGARLSGALPPFYPAVRWGERRVVDGVFLANVPSKIVKETMHADVVIAANVMPIGRLPGSGKRTSMHLEKLSLLGGNALSAVEKLTGSKWLTRVAQWAYDAGPARPFDATSGTFLLAARAGQDQAAALGPDVLLVQFNPVGAHFWDVSKGRDIVAQAAAVLKSGDLVARIQARLHERTRRAMLPRAAPGGAAGAAVVASLT